MADDIKRSDVDKLYDLKEFMIDRDAVRVKLNDFGLPKKGERTTPAIRDYVRTAVTKRVGKYKGREYVYAASLALNEVRISTNSAPSEHPEFWLLSAILGNRRDRFFNDSYLKREANALRHARLQNIPIDEILEFLATDRKTIERPPKRRKKRGITRGVPN